MVDLTLTEQDKVILEYILFNKKGIDEDTLYFDLSLYYNMRWWMEISHSLISLKMKKLISNERIYFRNGDSMIVYKGVK